ncbi:MAG: hypothetical protein J6J13_04250 [Clostridia bacterium]|nr:hypothetical protein [Clostridia bacterium]
MRFMYRLAQMMNGRYGVDKLFYIIFAVSSILAVVNVFLRSWIVQLIVYLLMIFGIFRMFSRNITARSKENRFVTGWIKTIKNKRDVRIRRAADITHIYKKCPKCHAVLRLPRRPGKHKTVCPKCSNEFKVTVRK